ncbi:putative invertase inhibitor [Dioscorea cayenensis subsp. rotundata]|uniref:Invertase inhibitor n=1 Tax=Dioscorea cayennensis subsp. rotundata TaxID=55577 RepID=A0AB40CN17_DIOCR|nr:putative invertase inhibitor [Dioscorea cayenensis subsp. rotundata]
MKHSTTTMISATLLSLLLLFLTAHLASAQANIQDTCKSAAAANPVINYDFCVSTFLRNPKSGSVDTRGLASIAALTSVNQAYNVKDNINNLLGNSPDPPTKSGLDQCMSLYTSMLNTLAQAVDAINGMQDDNAKGLLNTAIGAAQNCEAAFGQAGTASPLTQGNNDSVELSSMALAILDLAN